MPTRWYNDFASAQSNGTLPNKKTAKAVRIKKSIFWTVDLLGLGIGSKTKTGEWTITITNADGSQIYFKQTVKLSLMLVSLGAVGLQLFTWNVINGSSGEKYETSVVAGIPTTPDTIGQFLQGGTALSEQGIAIPGSGNESTDATATIIFDYFSPIYLFKAPGRQLPVGYKVKISRDTWGIGTANSTYQFAFEEGVPASLGSTFDPYGALLTARGAYDGERVFTGRAWRGNDYQFLDAGGALKGTSPTLHRLRDGRELMTLQTLEGVVEFLSINSEWNWKRMQYPNAEAGFGTKPDLIFGPDATMPLSLLLDNGARLHIAVEGTSLFSRLVDGGGPSEKVFVGAAGDGAFSLERDATGAAFIIGSDGLPKWKSRSIPPRWEPIQP